MGYLNTRKVEIADKVSKLSFKREAKPTGLRAVGTPYASTQIKRNKFQVGAIKPPNWESKDNKWAVVLYVRKSNSFNPVSLKQKFDNEMKAREYVSARWDKINSQFDLYELRD